MIGVWTFRVCDGPWTLNAETAVCLPPCLRVGDAQTTNLSLPFRDFASPVLRTLLICPSVSAVGVSFARCFGAERGMALFRFLASPFTGNNPPPVNINGPADQPQDNAHHRGVSTGGPAGRHVRGKFWCCFYPVVFLMTPLPLVVFLCIFGEISPCFLHDPERTVRRVTHGLEGSS